MNVFTFTWVIDHFSPTQLPNVPKQIRSPVFKAENLKETSWFLVITLESGGDYFACSLVRNESDAEEIDTIEINFNMEIAVEDRKVDVKAHTVNEMFKKGDSNLWGSFRFGSSAAQLMIRCHMFDCLQSKNSVSAGITIHSKIGHLSWSPSCISDTKSFCGAEATEFEVSLKKVNDKVSLIIRRTDNVITFSYYFVCTIFAYDKKNWIYSREIDNLRDPLNYNQTFELPLGLNINQTTRSGVYFIDIYFNCSALVGRMCFMSQEKSDYMCRINRPIETASMTSSDAFDTLRSDFESLYTKKIQTDVKLKVETEVFHVHKSILSARSPVFRTMFDQDMAESQTGVVHITDVNAKILNMFLMYMYTGSCGQLDCELALNLMLVAEKYQVYSLKKDCSAYLIPILSEDNVCHILCTADMVSDGNLKGIAMDYVKSHAGKILLSKSWKELVKNNASLVAETLCKLSADYGTKANENKDIMVSTLPSSVPPSNINLNLNAAFKHSANVRNLPQQKSVKQTLTKTNENCVPASSQYLKSRASILAEVNPQVQKEMLGEHLFWIIYLWYPDLAGKITGMLLEMDNLVLLYMLDDRRSLKAAVEEAVQLLRAYHVKFR